jgi:hypothetical protein
VHQGVRKIVIELDNGPHVQTYHSKYNPVERCWSCLERHWNGALLTDVNTALQWARTMTWNRSLRAKVGPTWVSMAGKEDWAATVSRPSELSLAAQSRIPAMLTQEWVCW